MRILILEDDARIADFVSNELKQAGYAVDVLGDGEVGLHFGLNNVYDAAVIDIMLPGCDGLSVIDQWRKARIATPVIILSAKQSVDDRIRGLQAGGDDYLTKPFAFSELLARVQALIRRSTLAAEPTLLNFSNLSLNLLTREVTRNGKKIELHAREFSLLEYMLRNPGRVLSKTMILEHVWDYAFDPKIIVVDVPVRRPRSSLRL